MFIVLSSLFIGRKTDLRTGNNEHINFPEKKFYQTEPFCTLGVQAKARHSKLKLFNMKPVFLFLVYMALSAACFSQTKRIAHRSHSGSNTSFTLAGEGNFGLPSEAEMKRMELERKKREAENKRIQDSITKANKKAGKNKLKTKKPATDSLKKSPSGSIQTLPSRPAAALILLFDFTELLISPIRNIGFHS